MPAPRLTLFLDRFSTPIGVMLVVTDEQHHLRALDWEEYEPRMQRLLQLHYGRDGVQLVGDTMPATLRTALAAYFAGNLAAIDAVPVTTGGTEFQRSVWAALRQIPAGGTVSYSQLAERIGVPRAVRAVGHANGANPVGLVVPCHRVVGADKSLTGYGGGIARKQWLLSHEGVVREPLLDVASLTQVPVVKKRRRVASVQAAA